MVSSASTDTAAPGPATAQQAGSGIGSLLRDPDHYEEINVIGNGKAGLFSHYCQQYFIYKNPKQT